MHNSDEVILATEFIYLMGTVVALKKTAWLFLDAANATKHTYRPFCLINNPDSVATTFGTKFVCLLSTLFAVIIIVLFQRADIELPIVAARLWPRTFGDLFPQSALSVASSQCLLRSGLVFGARIRWSLPLHYRVCVQGRNRRYDLLR